MRALRFDTFQDLIILTASRCLLGDDVRGSMFEEVSRLFELLDKGINPLSVFFPRAPTGAHRNRDNARREMQKLFSRLVASRRDEILEAERSGRTLPERNDVLQVCRAPRYARADALAYPPMRIVLSTLRCTARPRRASVAHPNPAFSL